MALDVASSSLELELEASSSSSSSSLELCVDGRNLTISTVNYPPNEARLMKYLD